MNHIRYLLISIIVSGLSSLCLASDPEPLEAKTLLQEARSATAKTSFSSVTPIDLHGQLQKTVKLYRKIAEDGKVLEREDNIRADSPAESCITNKSGIYVIRGEGIMKIPRRLSNRHLIYTGDDDRWGDSVEYVLAEGNYQNTPCHKVTVKIPKDEITREKLKFRYAGNIKTYPDYLEQRFPFEKTYLIDKEKKFIYSCTFFNSNGEKTFACDWGQVDFRTPIDEKQFETPTGKIVTVSPQDRETLGYLQTLFFMNLAPKERPQISREEMKEPENARDILFSAMRNSRKTTFSANLRVNKGGKYRKTIQVYHWPMPDGKIRERVEHKWSDTWNEIYVLNGKEQFAILDKTPIKTQFVQGSRRFIYESVRQDILEDAVYSMTHSRYNGNACYLITVKIPTDPEYVKNRVARIRQHSSKSEEELLKTMPFVKTYLVDKKNNFIYSCTFFSLLGRKISEAEWGNVVFSPSMDEKLFDAPEGKALVAKNYKDFLQIRERCLETFKQERRNQSKR